MMHKEAQIVSRNYTCAIMKKVLLFSIVLSIFALVSCGGGGNSSRREEASSTERAPSAQPNNAVRGNRPKIVAFGDSLTAGYNLPSSQSYPSLLQQKLDRDGHNYEVVNAGVSGDTSAGGLRRIDWALEAGEVRIVILELGANDILRGQPVSEMKRNLSQIIERAKSRGAQVLLAGMYAPTNTGTEYQRQVRDAFQELAREHNVAFIPFFLERVAGIESLNQADRVHPNPEGTAIVADTVYTALQPMLERDRLQQQQ
jgi:acyl-CoA thioesterase I